VRDITADINRAFEAAIRRDPANWFWVHDRWKPSRTKTKIEGGELKMESAR
jgi:KDO2-lipid IV(A) lauroyltransferase